MRKETMVEVKKEVLAELNVKEENSDVINENEYMEVDKAEIKKEEDMSEREKVLQKTVSNLLKKNRKRKDKFKAERRKVKALEQEVGNLRTRLQLYENTETSEDEAPPAKKPRQSSVATRAARLPKPAGAKARGPKCEE